MSGSNFLVAAGIINPDEEDKPFWPEFKAMVQDILRNGNKKMAGVEIGPRNIFAGTKIGEAVADGLDKADEDNAERQFGKPIKTIMKMIGDALPSINVAEPPITDYSFPVMSFIKDFIEFLKSLGIEGAYGWFFEFSPELFDLLTPEVMAQLADCEEDPVLFVEALRTVDPSIDAEKALEGAKKLCGFTIPTPPFLPLPFEIGFNLDFSFIFGFELPAWALNWNIDWPNWPFQIFIILSALLLLLQEKIDELIAIVIEHIPKGIMALLGALVLWFNIELMAIIEPQIPPLAKAAAIPAIISALLFIIIGAVVVCLIAFILGPGLISLSAAYALGLVE